MPRRGYALVTGRVLEQDPSLRKLPGLIATTEEYDDVSAVPARYLDLTNERQQLLQTHG